MNRNGPFGQGRYEWEVTFRENLGNLELLGVDAAFLTGTDAAADVIVMQEGDAASLKGDEPEIVAEDLVAGRPHYTGSYTSVTVGEYSIAVRQLLSGGLAADYFDNQWLQGDPVISRIDATANFLWGTGLVTTYGRDYVSARWSGKVRPHVSEMFTFFLFADEGARMWVDHQLVIDSWDHCCNESLAYVPLVAGAYHDLRLEWRELTGSASITLKWASLSTFKQVIPADQLYHAGHIADSPFPIAVVPGASDYPHTSAEGPGLLAATVGTPTHFTIQARDANANEKTEPGDDFTITLETASAMRPTRRTSAAGSTTWTTR